MMGFGKIEIKVDGQPVKGDVDELLEIGDVSEDMDKVAAQMAYWGAVWASAESEKEQADSYYRQWRANKGKELLEANDKLAEWKTRQEIESDPKFMKIKQGLATAIRNATLCRALYESFRTKANILQSKGAMMRAELDATGMHTKGDDKPKTRRQAELKEKRAANKAAMREIFKGKKAKAKA
jgi:hypothetical protein